jgi:hypothetical protein
MPLCTCLPKCSLGISSGEGAAQKTELLREVFELGKFKGAFTSGQIEKIEALLNLRSPTSGALSGNDGHCGARDEDLAVVEEALLEAGYPGGMELTDTTANQCLTLTRQFLELHVAKVSFEYAYRKAKARIKAEAAAADAAGEVAEATDEDDEEALERYKASSTPLFDDAVDTWRKLSTVLLHRSGQDARMMPLRHLLAKEAEGWDMPSTSIDELLDGTIKAHELLKIGRGAVRDAHLTPEKIEFRLLELGYEAQKQIVCKFLPLIKKREAAQPSPRLDESPSPRPDESPSKRARIDESE